VQSIQYDYTQDKDFLKNTAYPLLKSNAEFLLDYMVIDPMCFFVIFKPFLYSSVCADTERREFADSGTEAVG